MEGSGLAVVDTMMDKVGSALSLLPFILGKKLIRMK